MSGFFCGVFPEFFLMCCGVPCSFACYAPSLSPGLCPLRVSWTHRHPARGGSPIFRTISDTWPTPGSRFPAPHSPKPSAASCLLPPRRAQSIPCSFCSLPAPSCGSSEWLSCSFPASFPTGGFEKALKAPSLKAVEFTGPSTYHHPLSAVLSVPGFIFQKSSAKRRPAIFLRMNRYI